MNNKWTPGYCVASRLSFSPLYVSIYNGLLTQ
jgi:hypothetical protein